MAQTADITRLQRLIPSLLLVGLSVGCQAHAAIEEASPANPNEPTAGTAPSRGVVEVRPDSIAARGAEYAVEVVPEQRDYYLVSPHEPGRYAVSTHSELAQPKTKLVFDAPLTPGEYQLDLRDQAASDARTVVLNVPLSPGSYRFSVSLLGNARYDLVFHDQGPHHEYRYTLSAPLESRVFRLNLPTTT